MRWLHTFWAATAHYRVAAAIAVGAYRVWLKLPWWITNDEAKAERARKALDAIDPQRHWPWQRRG